jgi:hypothetical protein
VGSRCRKRPQPPQELDGRDVGYSPDDSTLPVNNRGNTGTILRCDTSSVCTIRQPRRACPRIMPLPVTQRLCPWSFPRDRNIGHVTYPKRIFMSIPDPLASADRRPIGISAMDITSRTRKTHADQATESCAPISVTNDWRLPGAVTSMSPTPRSASLSSPRLVRNRTLRYVEAYRPPRDGRLRDAGAPTLRARSPCREQWGKQRTSNSPHCR